MAARRGIILIYLTIYAGRSKDAGEKIFINA